MLLRSNYAQSKSHTLRSLSFCEAISRIFLKIRCLLVVESILFFLHLAPHQFLKWLVINWSLNITASLVSHPVEKYFLIFSS